MPPDNTHAPHLRFPRRIVRDRDAAERRLARLTDWRTGALALALLMAALLPFAIAWRDGYLIAIAASIILAAILALSTHIARRWQLATMALSPELVGLPDLAAERRRLQSAHTRRALAAGLRRAADPIQPPVDSTPAHSSPIGPKQPAPNSSPSPTPSNKRKPPIPDLSPWCASC